MLHRNKPVLVAYVSGHGYGHFTRSEAVLARLAETAEIHVRTSAQALRLARRMPPDRMFASVTEVDVGPGVAQAGPLAVDLAATRAALQQHLDGFDALVESEARALVRLGASAVFADVPPVAFAAAARAGVPSVGMSNFSWSWIYAGYETEDPWFGQAAARLARAEAEATLFLGLAMGGGLEVFPRIEPIPPVARRPVRDRAEVRSLLGLTDEKRPVVLTSFGGFGGELDLRTALAGNPDHRFLVVSGPSDLALHNATSIDPSAGAGDAGGLTHPELTQAADCVIGKPGYGTVAECLFGPTPFVYVPRGAFREYPPLVEAIARYLPSAPLSLADLSAGRWSDAIARAMAARPPEVAPAANGAEVAAARIASLMGAG